VCIELGVDSACLGRKFVLPVLAKSPNGLYLRPKQMGWAVAVANPGAIKTLFLRKGIFLVEMLLSFRGDINA
jgi:hypothetical protein